MIQNLTLEQLSALIAFFVTLFGGLSYVLKPLKNYKDKQEETDNRIKKLEENEEKDTARFEKYDKDLQQVLLSVNVLLSHSIDNNHTQQLKERKAELDEYLIKR